MNTKKTFYNTVAYLKSPLRIHDCEAYLSRRSSGFILVEVIVSISILMLAVPAALTIASKSVFLASYSKDQVIATYLAQEGIEIIRNRRDQNILRGITWDDGFSSGDCQGGLKCIVDLGWGASDPVIQKCVGSCSFVLSLDTASGAYAHQSGGTWVLSPFSRSVHVSNVPGGSNPNEIRVESTVTYNTHGIDKTITLMENLTPWLQ